MFNLTFFEAVTKCLDGEGFIQGSDFADGVYVKVNGDTLVSIDGSNFHREIGPLQISRGITRQKFKIFNVASRQNINK